jgi:hypothetical protein
MNILLTKMRTAPELRFHALTPPSLCYAQAVNGGGSASHSNYEAPRMPVTCTTVPPENGPTPRKTN